MLSSTYTVIRQECPGIDFYGFILRKPGQTGKEILAIFIDEDLALLDSPPHDMMQNPRGI